VCLVAPEMSELQRCPGDAAFGVSMVYLYISIYLTLEAEPAGVLWRLKEGRANDLQGPKAATRVAASTPSPKRRDVFKGALLRLPKPPSDQFPVRVCSCPLCI